MSAEQVTARYRAAKKAQIEQACAVGAARSELAALTSRADQRARNGQDCGHLDILMDRANAKLLAAEANLQRAADQYRVAHLELLLTPGPQRHYVDAISKQRLMAHISKDENENAILHAMQRTLALIFTLAAQRTVANNWAIKLNTDTETRAANDELKATAAATLLGAFRPARGPVLEVIDLGGGMLGTTRGPLGAIPYDYVPGAPFTDGHLMLTAGLQLAKHVEAAVPTGYAAARSVIL